MGVHPCHVHVVIELIRMWQWAKRHKISKLDSGPLPQVPQPQKVLLLPPKDSA